jgi:N-acetylmuramoyl-L-alanine amidase
VRLPRIRSGSLWRRVVFWWHARERGGLAVVAMAAVPVVALGSIVTFARSGHSGDDTARAEAAQIRARELHCLAENIYYEARGEPLDGQYAVAEVTLNRVRSPRYADTICEVVYDTRWDPLRRRRVGHFSWTELQERDEPWGPAWEQAMTVANAVYNESYMPLVPNALHYHAVSVQPYWARSMDSVAKIGNHVFYR